MKNKFISFLFLCSLCITNGIAQNLDSLKNVLKGNLNDTTRCKILSSVIELELSDEVWPKYNEKLRDIAKAKLRTETKGKPLYKFYLKYLAIATSNIGFINVGKGDVINAQAAFLKTLEMEKELGDQKRLANCYNSLAQTYSMQGDIVKALKYSEQTLSMYEKAKDDAGVATILNNLAVLYEGQGEREKALEYALRALTYQLKGGDQKGIANAYSNIGYLYKVNGNIEKAMTYYQQALTMREGLNDKQGISVSLNNIGRIFEKKKEYVKALEYFNRAMRIQRELDDKDGLSISLNNIGNIYLIKGDLSKALENSCKSLKMAQEIGIPNGVLMSASILKDIYFKQGNFASAYKMQELQYQMRDSINNKETRRAAIKNQLKYEFGKRAIADSIKATEEKRISDLEIANQQAQIKQERTFRYGLYIGLIVMVAFAGFIFNRFKVTQKQKNIIDGQRQEVINQKNIIEEKQKEIVDSINYAKRLQEAIMPTKQAIDVCFEDNFIFYRPKDIVAGDFYWMETRGELVYIAAADCTGHGVPGALVSVVCSNALNRSVLEFGMKEPGEILDKTRELVVETFEKSTKDVKDGMDISLCCINKRTNEFMWAGANNPLWVIKTQDTSSEFLELKPTKQSVGKTDAPVPFKTHHLKLQKGDLIYMFTDGYADQFGGMKGKKFKYKQLQETVVSIRELLLPKQMIIIEQKFNEWKNALEQVDDILIIGIRV
ncbi:MAG: tetratricopeptide repeat protein [Bacteroidota bacterium]|nr:tetratricopeptide repeat protein [Bacteroidota bacterium]